MSRDVDVEREVKEIREILKWIIDTIKFNAQTYEGEINRIYEKLDRLEDYMNIKKAKTERPRKMITEKQKAYLIILYKRLGRTPPKDMDKWDREFASSMIDDLNTELRRGR